MGTVLCVEVWSNSFLFSLSLPLSFCAVRVKWWKTSNYSAYTSTFLERHKNRSENYIITNEKCLLKQNKAKFTHGKELYIFRCLGHIYSIKSKSETFYWLFSTRFFILFFLFFVFFSVSTRKSITTKCKFTHSTSTSIHKNWGLSTRTPSIVNSQPVNRLNHASWKETNNFFFQCNVKNPH